MAPASLVLLDISRLSVDIQGDKEQAPCPQARAQQILWVAPGYEQVSLSRALMLLFGSFGSESHRTVRFVPRWNHHTPSHCPKGVHPWRQRDHVEMIYLFACPALTSSQSLQATPPVPAPGSPGPHPLLTAYMVQQANPYSCQQVLRTDTRYASPWPTKERTATEFRKPPVVKILFWQGLRPGRPEWNCLPLMAQATNWVDGLQGTPYSSQVEAYFRTPGN